MAQPHKSPYEIRQNLLELAFNSLREQHAAKAAATGKPTAATTAPTTDEVIEEARRLNEFVSARGERQ